MRRRNQVAASSGVGEYSCALGGGGYRVAVELDGHFRSGELHLGDVQDVAPEHQPLSLAFERPWKRRLREPRPQLVEVADAARYAPDPNRRPCHAATTASAGVARGSAAVVRPNVLIGAEHIFSGTTTIITKDNPTSLRVAVGARISATDAALLAAAVAAVQAAGAHMLTRFNPRTRTPQDLKGVVTAIYENDAASLAVARELLQRARPAAGWVDDELEGGALADGEWWIVDPVEGNVNHVHGLTDWGVSATLVRDNVPVLTAVHEPVAGRLYTAARGSSVAHANGVPMRPSAETELKAAIVTTGQAKPGESAETYRRIGQSVTAMLHAALVVRMTVPATFQLALVAGGHIDGFWQHSDVRSGLAAMTRPPRRRWSRCWRSFPGGGNGFSTWAVWSRPGPPRR